MAKERTPGLRIERSLGEKDFITYLPSLRILESMVREIKKPTSVMLDLHGWWYDEPVELFIDQELKLAQGLTVRIHDFRGKDRICLQYTGPKDLYHIIRYEIFQKKP